MTKSRGILKKWEQEEIETLCDNWSYFLKNKDIAVEKLGHSWSSIATKAGDMSICIREQYKSNPCIIGTIKSYFDGLVLSDGYIHESKCKLTGAYFQKCKYKEWLIQIQKKFTENNIISRIDYKTNAGGFKLISGDKKVHYVLSTLSYIEFKTARDRWYKIWYDIDNYPETLWHKDKDGEYFIYKKIVPEDIYLSSECVLNWYLGDGWFNNYNNTIELSTLCFLKEDTEFLSSLLNDSIDIKSKVNKRSNIQITDKRSINNFINYIKDLKKPDCYSYKFPENIFDLRRNDTKPNYRRKNNKRFLI